MKGQENIELDMEIITILKQGDMNRKQLIKELNKIYKEEMARTTVFDHLTKLRQKGIVGKYGKPLKKRSHPNTIWTIDIGKDDKKWMEKKKGE